MKRLLFAFAALLILCLGSSRISAQGMPIDSLRQRLSDQLGNPFIVEDLQKLIPNYANQRVWGLTVGDFSNDSLPDLGISLYEIGGPRNTVTVYLFQNIKGQHLQKVFERQIAYVESPIEVGLLSEGSVVTIVQKSGDQHWYQEGYSIEDGDLVLVDHYETAKQDIPGSKIRSVGHETYRNYESLLSRESFFAGNTGDQLLGAKFYTFPAYRRLKNVYPGYGYGMTDTSVGFMMQGLGLRKDAADLSIRNAVTSYDDDFLYFSISVNDDNVVGGAPKDEANDHVSLWFDADLNADRRVKTTKNGLPTFRTAADSNIYNITFILPQSPGRISKVLYSSEAKLSGQQAETMKSIKALMSLDTASDGRPTGYTLRARIPFTFFGYETNPVNTYERGPDFGSTTDDSTNVPTKNILDRSDLEDAPSLGFTALVYDVDDPTHPDEVKVQATSNFKANDPTTFGTLILEPSTKFYGEVQPTYTETIKEGLARSGF